MPFCSAFRFRGAFDSVIVSCRSTSPPARASTCDSLRSSTVTTPWQGTHTATAQRPQVPPRRRAQPRRVPEEGDWGPLDRETDTGQGSKCCCAPSRW